SVTFIAIDLGTSYSRVGIFKNGRVEIIPNDQGSRMTPSYVAFTAEGERLIGDAAKSQLTSNPENTVFDVKRLMGREFSDPRVNGRSSNHGTAPSLITQYWNYIIQIFSDLFRNPIVETAGTADRPDPPLPSVQPVIKKIPFTVINRKSKPTISINVGSKQKYFEPEEISAMLLRKMRETAEAYLGYKVTHAIVTVPAYFNDAQREATLDAGTISGLSYVRLINEPIAAVIAYGLDKLGGEKNIVVFDLGGETLCVSVVNIDNGFLEVVDSNDNTHLGGKDFDERVMEYFIKLFKKKTGKDVRKSNQAIHKLRHETERAKRILSSENQTTIEIASFYNNEDFNEILTREKFEELNMALFRSAIQTIQKVLEDADLKKVDIAEVVLVGGSTRIPKVQQLVKDYFHGKEPLCGINPDEVIAYGAA
ncbi:unnamed protein product, partial [Adineta steineri]